MHPKESAKADRFKAAEKAGYLAETRAVLWYRLRGFRIVARRWHSHVGEIDIIARRGQLLVFCEVKFRRKDIHMASPLPRQQKRITRAASLFITRSPFYQNYECRFDVILIERKPNALWSRLIPIVNAW
ncbi:YraN family protein [Alphaproteobacteria bacterium]|nr:YraN family protein [Alphaproteobacteria bacterium]